MVFHAVFKRNRFRGLRPSNGEDPDEELDLAADKQELLERDARNYLSQLSDRELMHVRKFFEFQSSVYYWLIRKLADSHLREVYRAGPREVMELYLKAHVSPDLLP